MNFEPTSHFRVLAPLLKRAALAIMLCLGWTVGAPQAAQPAETLVFVAQPLENPEQLAAQWKPFLDRLAMALGVAVRFQHISDNDEINERFRAGKIDLAQLGPLPYVILRESFAPATPLVFLNESDGRADYTCALVAPAEAKLKARDLAKLKNKKIALTQPLSTCGYLAAASLLRGAGGALENHRYRYLGRHDTVALSILRGEFDLGSMKTQIARKYDGLGLAVVAETKPLPGFALVANAATVSPERMAQIRKYLLGADAAARGDWGAARHGVTPAQDSDYDAVRRLRVQTKIPETGNF
jgi:phosphonate transport system substrate-binding protein